MANEAGAAGWPLQAGRAPLPAAGRARARGPCCDRGAAPRRAAPRGPRPARPGTDRRGPPGRGAGRQVLHEMLELVRDHAENDHSSHLEWIVIWLIVICAALGVFEVLGTLGLVGPGGHWPGPPAPPPPALE